MIIRNSYIKTARGLIGDAPCTFSVNRGVFMDGNGFFCWVGFGDLNKPFSISLPGMPPDIFKSEYIHVKPLMDSTLQFHDSDASVTMHGEKVFEPQVTMFVVNRCKMIDLFDKVEKKYHEKCRKLLNAIGGEMVTITNRSIIFDDGRYGVLTCN